MTKINCTRTGCKDVFHAFLVEKAEFAADLEIPCMLSELRLPAKMIPFSKAINSLDYECWVHFYEDDASFERIWNNPRRYLPILKKFSGVISPDFSLYRDMPLVMQQWNTYRGRAIGRWLQDNNVSVLPNVRWGDSRTFSLSCIGVPRNGTIVIGSHGCLKSTEDRKFFIDGLAYVIKTLTPNTILVYGSATPAIFGKYKSAGIRIIKFDSTFSMKHKKVVVV